MVDINPAEWDARRKAGKAFGELTDTDKAIIGWPGAKNLRIPMADTFTLRRMAGEIHSLASDLDMLSRRQDLSLRLMALSIQDAVTVANSEIRRVTGTEKARRPRR